MSRVGAGVLGVRRCGSNLAQVSVPHQELTDEERAVYTGEPISPRTARLVTWGLVAAFGGFVIYMVLAATVLKGNDAPGVTFREIQGQPIYVHQPPQSTDSRVSRGSSDIPNDSAHRWVVRNYITRLTPDQVRDWYLRQWATQYALVDSHVNDTDENYVLRGTVALSELTTADPPNLAVRIAIGKEQLEERTQVALSLESDF